MCNVGCGKRILNPQHNNRLSVSGNSIMFISKCQAFCKGAIKDLEFDVTSARRGLELSSSR
jgi:hypothetical protein